jgi:hypothetical protein
MKEMFKKYPPSRNLNNCYSSISGQGEVNSKGNNKITELRAILQRESQNS